jgi:[acyl-carrier-protein] S-malonyltransferase
MLQKLAAVSPAVVNPIFRHASEVLGRSLDGLDAFETDRPRNEDVQLAVFLANHAHWQLLRDAGLDGDCSAGLSLGEYNHLVQIGALTFDTALQLVAARGAAYDNGPRGAMAAVFPVEAEAVADAIARSRQFGVIEIANYNSPSQHVIAGDRRSLDTAMRILEDDYAANTVMLDDRLPMHCSLFAPVAAALWPALHAATITSPVPPYMPNVLGRAAEDSTPDGIRTSLAAQVHQPVHFRHAVDAFADAFPGCAFVEVGPKSVVYNLLSKKWRSFQRYKTDAEAGVFVDSIASLAKNLQRAA